MPSGPLVLCSVPIRWFELLCPVNHRNPKRILTSEPSNSSLVATADSSFGFILRFQWTLPCHTLRVRQTVANTGIICPVPRLELEDIYCLRVRMLPEIRRPLRFPAFNERLYIIELFRSSSRVPFTLVERKNSRLFKLSKRSRCTVH